MPQEERWHGRDRIYSAWHRRKSTQRYVGIEAAQTLAMIDTDACMWVEYSDGDKEPVALMETAQDVGQNIKPATVLKRLVQRCFPILPAYVVLYQVSDGMNPAEIETHDIQMFRVKRIWPEPETPWIKLSPTQWANHLCNIRRWGAHLGETGVRERLPSPPVALGDLFKRNGA
jgi:hypothetical protein